MELPVEVRELASGILEEKAASETQREAKQIDRQGADKQKDRASVGAEQDGFISGHELQLIEEPKAVCEKHDDGKEQGVGDHLKASSSRK